MTYLSINIDRKGIEQQPDINRKLYSAGFVDGVTGLDKILLYLRDYGFPVA